MVWTYVQLRRYNLCRERVKWELMYACSFVELNLCFDEKTFVFYFHFSSKDLFFHVRSVDNTCKCSNPSKLCKRCTVHTNKFSTRFSMKNQNIKSNASKNVS